LSIVDYQRILEVLSPHCSLIDPIVLVITYALCVCLGAWSSGYRFVLTNIIAAGSTNSTVTEASRWQEWLMFADLFYFFMSTGCLDFLELIDKLAVRFANGTVMASNHVTWLLAQVFRLEIVTSALSSDSQVIQDFVTFSF